VSWGKDKKHKKNKRQRYREQETKECGKDVEG
jgi:hypothetical protein